MSALANKIAKEDKLLKKKANFLMLSYQKEMGDIIQKGFESIIHSIVNQLLYVNTEETSYMQMRQMGIFKRLEIQIESILESVAIDVERYWTQKRKNIDLLSRLSISYLNKKSSPPWLKTKINLKDKLSTDDRFDPGKGHFRFYFAKMADTIMQQIQQGALKEETTNQIVKRVKRLMNRNSYQNVREIDQKYKQSLKNNPMDEELSYGPIEMEYGFFKEDDIEELKDDMIKANQFEHRQYRPWFTDEVLKNNKQIYLLEQMLYADALNLINSGNVETMPELAGIKDMEWSVQRPGVCDCCDSRDGLTASEIKEKIDDDYGDMPPPLHPNCNCEYMPVLKDDWKDKELSEQGVSWDPWSGKLEVPKDVKNKYRMDLDFDEFLDVVKKGGTL